MTSEPRLVCFGNFTLDDIVLPGGRESRVASAAMRSTPLSVRAFGLPPWRWRPDRQ